MQKKFDEIAYLADATEDNCAMLCNLIQQVATKVSRIEQGVKSSHVLNNTTSHIDCAESSESLKRPVDGDKVHSLVAVRRQSRPPTKRKVSNVEKSISKNKKVHDNKS